MRDVTDLLIKLITLDPGGMVELPTDQEAFFPFMCAGCGDPEPEDLVRLSARAIGALDMVLPIPMGRKHVAEFPACLDCAGKRKRMKIVRALVGFPWFLAALFIALVISTRLLPNPWYIPLAMVIVVVLVAPALIWSIFRPIPFEFAVTGRTAKYTFAQKYVAEEFATCNDAELKDWG